MTYKNDCNDGEHHDGSPLADRLLCLLGRLPGLYYGCLLLFEGQEVVNLVFFGKSQLPKLFTDGLETCTTYTLCRTRGGCPKSFELLDSVIRLGEQVT